MIKKIFNWTAGGFFRKLGGILVYLIIGIIVSIVLLKDDRPLDKLLGIQSVYADTISWTSKYSRIYYDDHGTERNYNFLTMPRVHTSDYPITQMEYRLGYSGGFSSGNTYTFSVDYTPVPDSLYVTGLWFSDGTNRFTDVNCGGWSRNSSGTYSNLCAVSPPVDIPSSGYMYVRIVYASSYVDSLTSGVSNFSITKGTGAIIQDSAIDIMNNQNQLMTNQCSNLFNVSPNFTTKNCLTFNNDNGNITVTGTPNASGHYNYSYIGTFQPGTYYFKASGNCNNVSWYVWNQTLSQASDIGSDTINLTSESLLSLTAYIHGDSSTSCNVNLMFSRDNVPYCKYGSTTNKLDDVNSSLNNLTDTLTDDNVSSDVNDAFDFFNEFNLQGAGNFTQIVLLPINFLSTLVLGNEDDLCFTLKGQRSCLPNGKILWKRNNTSCNSDIMLGCATTSTTIAFRTFFSIVVGGYLSYKFLVHIVHMWHKILDPTKDNLEVLKL